MKKHNYHCEFPRCEYVTTSRSQIHYHHIIPKELGGTNTSQNRIWLCPTHHTHIYVPDAQQGHHTQTSEHSIVLLGWRTSTKGKALLYRVFDDVEVQYYFL